MKVSEKIEMLLYVIILSIIAFIILYFMYIYPILQIIDYNYMKISLFFSYLLN